MINGFRTLEAVIASIILFMSIATASANQKQKSAADEYSEALKWFEALKFPNVAGKRFIQLKITERERQEYEPREVKIHGFVLAGVANQYTVFTTNLRLIQFSVHANEKQMQVKTVDFKKYAERAIQNSDIYGEANVPGFCWEMGRDFGRYRQFRKSLSLDGFSSDFCLSVFCKQAGLVSHSEKLAKRAIQTKWQLSPIDRLKNHLEIALGATFTERAIASLANPVRSRADVVAKFDWIEKHFNGIPTWSGEPIEMVPVLRKMVEEDEQQLWKKLVTKEHPATPKSLVYLLRDQTWWFDDGPKPGDPAAQLIELGPQAVPALIDAIGDQRVTKVVGFDRPLRGGQIGYLTVDGCAFHLLLKILGDVPPGDYDRSPETPEEIEKTKKAFRDYWKAKGKELD